MNNLNDILDKVEEALNKLYEKDQYLIYSEENNHVSERSITHKLGVYLTPLFEGYDVNDTLRMYKNDDIRMYNFNCITDTIVEVITTCNTYTLLTVHLL